VTNLRTVVVTRPGAAGQRLADELQAAGQPALWLPAFEFGPPPDDAVVRETLAGLARFDLAIVVSPQAARATGALLAQPWPAHTVIAAVGAGTRAAVVAAIQGAATAALLAPTDDSEPGGGSESLWPLLQRLQPVPRHVLLLRAQGGRDWLAERLREQGATVVPLAVYSRLPSVPQAGLRARLAQAAATGLASVVSSSDAVAALTDLFESQPQVMQALHHGPAFASHARIAERLRAAGFGRVTLCSPEASALLAALREGDG
jgi:uroporphyrinogen-III synthase